MGIWPPPQWHSHGVPAEVAHAAQGPLPWQAAAGYAILVAQEPFVTCLLDWGAAGTNFPWSQPSWGEREKAPQGNQRVGQDAKVARSQDNVLAPAEWGLQPGVGVQITGCHSQSLHPTDLKQTPGTSSEEVRGMTAPGC